MIVPARFAKFLATLPGLIAVVVSLNVLHGQALTYAVMVEAVITRLLVVVVPNAARPAPPQGEPVSTDVGPGTTVPEPPKV